MLYYYRELIKKGINKYQIEKKVNNKELFKMSQGLYSDEEYPSDLSIIAKKYPTAIITLNSAFYYYDLTDKIPDYYYVATDRKAYIMTELYVKQIYMDEKFLNIGVTNCKIEDVEVNIYDKERMLIELIRYKTKLPYELYKDVINSYRKIKNELNFINLYNYAKLFNRPYIIQTIEKEVM